MRGQLSQCGELARRSGAQFPLKDSERLKEDTMPRRLSLNSTHSIDILKPSRKFDKTTKTTVEQSFALIFMDTGCQDAISVSLRIILGYIAKEAYVGVVPTISGIGGHAICDQEVVLRSIYRPARQLHHVSMTDP